MPNSHHFPRLRFLASLLMLGGFGVEEGLAQSPELLWTTLKAIGQWVGAPSPDGALAAVLIEDTEVGLCRVSAGGLARLLLSLVPVYLLSFSPDGTLLGGGGQPTTPVWQVSDGATLLSLQLDNYYGARALAFFPDGERIVVADGGWDIRLWRVADGLEEPPLTATMALC